MLSSRMFPGGTRPKEGINGKETTKDIPIKKYSPPRVVISMYQHIGTDCKPIVKAGDTVLIGQKIGEPVAPVAAPIHSSVSGTVVDVSTILLPDGIKTECVVIDNDFQDKWVELKPVKKPKELTAEDLRKIIHDSGIVGQGGAMFPTSIKIIPPEGLRFDTLIINGAECEPYLSADHRLMLENAEEIVDGISIMLRSLGIPRAIIGVENNKKDAISLLKEKTDSHSNITVKSLPAIYPQGGEKQLIFALTKRRVPNCKLPASVGCLVCNVGTVAAISNAVRLGRPVVDRILTVAGMVGSPGNFIAPIGTPVKDLFEFAGGIKEGAKKIIYGGPMMGMAFARMDLYVVKGCTGILALGEESVAPAEENCIRCGRCSRGCPMELMPMFIDQHVRKFDVDNVEKLGVENCIECGVCSYVCPAKRYLKQSMTIGKNLVYQKTQNICEGN